LRLRPRRQPEAEDEGTLRGGNGGEELAAIDLRGTPFANFYRPLRSRGREIAVGGWV